LHTLRRQFFPPVLVPSAAKTHPPATMVDAKALKKLTKKLGREPTEEELKKYLAKKDKKDGKRKAEDEPEEAAAEESPKKAKKAKKEKKSKKEKEEKEEEVVAAEPAAEESEDEMKVSGKSSGNGAANPDGIVKVFCGNLSYQIDDDAIKAFMADCGTITDIHWLTDKETGKFFGSGFLEFDSSEGAAKAVAKAGQDLLGRPIKVDFAKPKADRGAGGAGGGKGGGKTYPMSDKPEGCTTIFLGNLDFNVEDQNVHDHFKEIGEIKQIRWLTDRDTGAFKGCGFVEFVDPGSIDQVAPLNGSMLLGRALRVDYSAPRKPKEW